MIAGVNPIVLSNFIHACPALAAGYYTPGHGSRNEGAPHPAMGHAPALSKPRALVVDDAPDVTEMLAVFLQHAGYETVMAFNAPEALDAARSGEFDLVISDIGMPGMNGYELAAALRRLPGYNATPLVAVTGFSHYDDRERALESGFNAHLTKPVNPLTLLQLIERLRA